jgi:hypothetical protein
MSGKRAKRLAVEFCDSQQEELKQQQRHIGIFSTSVCVCVCACVCVCLCMHACVCLCMHACVCVCACMYVSVSVCVCVCLRMCVCMCVCVCVFVHACMHACMCACVCLCVHACMCVCFALLVGGPLLTSTLKHRAHAEGIGSTMLVMAWPVWARSGMGIHPQTRQTSARQGFSRGRRQTLQGQMSCECDSGR